MRNYHLIDFDNLIWRIFLIETFVFRFRIRKHVAAKDLFRPFGKPGFDPCSGTGSSAFGSGEKAQSVFKVCTGTKCFIQESCVRCKGS